jgi:hypothetical protein
MYPADDCPICQANGKAPVTTNRVPHEPTPQPKLKPAPAPEPPTVPADEPPAFEPLPPAELPPAEPPTTPPTFEPPGADMPPEKPAPADVDDLFKEPAPGAAPAEPATPPGDVDDLFKEPAPGAEPAEPAAPGTPGDVDDLFKVDDKKAASSQELEDLFAEPAAPVGAEETKALEDEADKLFGESGTAEAMRLWTDSTGKYHVRARLVVVGPSYVRLLKENGKHTTVAFERLSRADLAFVRQQADRAIAASF